MPSVWIADDEVAETLFSYLAALGHTRIAYVAGPAELEHTRLRAEVLHAMASDGIAGEVITTDFSPPGPQPSHAPSSRAACARRLSSTTTT